MGRSTLSFPIPRGWSPEVVETGLVAGADGVEARFRAVGAADEIHDLAIARDEPPSTDPHGPILGVVRDGGARLEIGWSDAAGLCSMLVAYGIHLLLVPAHTLGDIEDVDRVVASGKFVEIRGRLAERRDEGFALQPIGAKDDVSLPPVAEPFRSLTVPPPATTKNAPMTRAPKHRPTSRAGMRERENAGVDPEHADQTGEPPSRRQWRR